MLREASLILVGVAILTYVLAFILEFIFTLFDDPREPRRITSKLPIIGHILGVWRYRFDYYNVIR
jgi:hypothetical protein